MLQIYTQKYDPDYPLVCFDETSKQLIGEIIIQQLEQATKLINTNWLLGGETQMWLVNAYQAAGKPDQAITLCQKLMTHPHRDIRGKSANLL